MILGRLQIHQSCSTVEGLLNIAAKAQGLVEGMYERDRSKVVDGG